MFSALFKKEVGPYVLGQLLGTGATSTVHLGEHKDTKKLVAIKMVKRTQKSRLHDSVFEREVNALKQLSHNNLLRLESIFRDDEHDCIVLEYASGGDMLGFVMSEGSFRGGEDSRHNTIILHYRYIHQLLDGVQFLHDSNFVHRDLKLENLMIDACGCLKIGDFGLSLLYDGHMQGATGTLEYMAPEVAQGLAYDPQPADIWSIGVILFCMLSGNFPFSDKRAIIAVDYECPPYFTMPMRSLISGILQRDPKRRLSIQAIRESELLRSVTPAASLLEQFYTALKLKRESEDAGLQQSPGQRFRRASLSVVFARKVSTALSSPTIHGAGRDVRMVCHDRLTSLMELLLAHSTADSSTYQHGDHMMRKSQLRSINWVTASSDPAMSLQMSLADELSRCSLDASLLPIEHRAYTFVNVYNLLFLFSCIMHKAHPSSMSASEQNDFFGCRQHCLSFEMVSLDELLHGLLRNNKSPNRRWHFRRIFSAERMLQMQELSCAPPYLPHQPVEALLWVLGIENGCELRVFESTPGKPTMQALTQQKLEETCVIKGSVVALPWQFKYFAKDFGDTEPERLITLARLMGSKGDALLKLYESGSLKMKVETPPDGSVALHCFMDMRRTTSLDMRRPLVKQNSFRVNRSLSDPGAYEAASASFFTPKAADSVAGAAGPVDVSPPPPPPASKSPEKSGSSSSVKSDKCCVQ